MKKYWNSLIVAMSLMLIIGETSLGATREPHGDAPSSDPSTLNQRIRVIRAKDHVTIPIPNVVASEFSQTPRIEILNYTGAYLTVYFSGPSSRQVKVRPGAGESTTLIAGNYEVAAEVNDPGVLPFFGNHRYDREDYQIRFSIRSTSR